MSISTRVNIEDDELKKAVLDRIADRVVQDMSYEERQKLTERVRTYIKSLDTAELNKTLTRALLARALGEVEEEEKARERGKR